MKFDFLFKSHVHVYCRVINLITNSFYEQISNDGEIIVNGIMLNYEELKNLNIGNFY